MIFGLSLVGCHKTYSIEGLDSFDPVDMGCVCPLFEHDLEDYTLVGDAALVEWAEMLILCRENALLATESKGNE